MLTYLTCISCAPFSTVHRKGFKDVFLHSLKIDDYCWGIYKKKNENCVQEVPIWHLQYLLSFWTGETDYNYNFCEACKVSWYWFTIDGPHWSKSINAIWKCGLKGFKGGACNRKRQQQSQKKAMLSSHRTFIFIFNMTK